MPTGMVWGQEDNSSLVIILEILRRGTPLTRPQLIATTGLGRRVVAQRVDDLIASGLVADGPTIPSTGGRPASTVAFRPDAGIVLVAEISPSVIRAGFCNLGGELVEWLEEPVSVGEGPEAILDRVQQHWDELLRARGSAHPPLMAIGIGVIGPVDTDDIGRSQVVTPFGWDGAHVRDRLSQRYDVPVWADNEVNMMALAEYRRHAHSGPGDLVLVLIDEGIGAGLISNGALHRGSNGIAGELGHISVSNDPRLVCWCGKIGCLTQVASTAAIERDLGRRVFRDSVGGQHEERVVVASADSLGLAEDERFREAGDATGRVLADVVTLFNPSEIVLGGRVPAIGEKFLEPLRRALQQRAFSASAAELRISVASQEDQLGLLGAGIMAIDGFLGASHAPKWLRRG